MKNNILARILKHKISFLANLNSDEYGKELWQEQFSCFAEIKPLYDSKFGSLENFNFGHVVTEAYFMFKIRYSPLLNNRMRIRFRERVFEIKRLIDPDETRHSWHIIALEII